MADYTIYAKTTDFSVQSTGSDWGPADAGTSRSQHSTGTTLRVGGSYNTSPTMFAWQAFLEFDTSAVPAGAVSNLKLVMSPVVTSPDSGTSFHIREYAWSGTTPWRTEAQADALPLFGTLTRFGTMNPSPLTSIPRSTSYKLMLLHDSQATTKPSDAYNDFASANYTGTSSDPRLTFTITPPPTITTGSSVTVAENIPTSTTIYDANADQAITSWSLAGTDASSFNINSAGEVKFNTSPNYETKSSYLIQVRATNANGTGTKDVAITVTDVDEVAPVITSGNSATVAENIAPSTVIGIAVASKPSNWSLTGTDAASFTIDADDGEIRFVASPNYEAKASYSFNVVATAVSNGLTATQPFTVTVTDVDEVAPTVTSAASVEIAENTPASTVVYQATASKSSTWTLGGADALFFSIDAATGEVRLLSSPDYEQQTSYAITVTATATANGLTGAKAVSVIITDINETIPATITSGSSASVPENTPIGTPVYTGTSDMPVTWSLGGTDAAAFTIDTDDGQVRFVAPPDYETKSSYSIDVIATNATSITTTKPVTITVTDVADETPPTITSGSTFTVAENTSTATPVYTAAANEPVSWTLTGADAALLTINASGQVRFVSAPDFEAKSSYSFNVVATDAAGLSTSKAITGTITDVAEAPPPTVTSSGVVSVAENVSTSLDVYTATADQTVTWSLGGTDADAFTINPTTGALRFVASPDYETKNAYSLQLIATNSGGSTGTKALAVNVTDVLETDPGASDTLLTATTQGLTGGQGILWTLETMDGDPVTPASSYLTSVTSPQVLLTLERFQAARGTSAGIVAICTVVENGEPIVVEGNLVQDRWPIDWIQDGANGLAPRLTKANLLLPADANGVITSYALATGNFVITSGGVDVSSNFTFSDHADPQGLTPNPSINPTTGAYTVSGGFDAAEEFATITYKATGKAGTPYEGIEFFETLTLGKAKVGANGVTTYTWIAYASNATGTQNFTKGSPTEGVHIYIGIATNKTTATESSNPADYTWSKWQGQDAYGLGVWPTRGAISYDAAGNLSPSTQTNLFLAERVNASGGTVSWEVYDLNQSLRFTPPNGNSYSMSASSFNSYSNGTNGVVVKAYLTLNGVVVAQGQTTVMKQLQGESALGFSQEGTPSATFINQLWVKPSEKRFYRATALGTGGWVPVQGDLASFDLVDWTMIEGDAINIAGATKVNGIVTLAANDSLTIGSVPSGQLISGRVIIDISLNYAFQIANPVQGNTYTVTLSIERNGSPIESWQETFVWAAASASGTKTTEVRTVARQAVYEGAQGAASSDFAIGFSTSSTNGAYFPPYRYVRVSNLGAAN